MVDTKMKYNKRNGDYIHKEYPKSCAPDDFWGQVKRTVNGVPVPQEQINMIVSAVNIGLKLNKDDVLLDIGCGNAALSHYFINSCSQIFGVDFSKYLISVAKANFEQQPYFTFEEMDAVQYVDWEPNPGRFSKALCYGCLPYLPPLDAVHVLRRLYENFWNIETVYIGNLPDRDRAHLFYRDDKCLEHELDDHTTSIGIWRSKAEMQKLAGDTGWHVRFHHMPRGFYAAHYRYDAVLTKQ